MNYDMFLFHGHGEGDSGAVGNGLIELEIAKEITGVAVNMLRSKGVLVKTNYDSGYNNYHRNLTKGDNFKYRMGATIHINSGGGYGSELIVPLGESYLNIETEISNNLQKLGLYERGIKSRYYDTDNFSQHNNGEKLQGKDWYKEIREAWQNGNSLTIIELGFIDNNKDATIIENNVNEIATIIANAYLKEMNKPTYDKPIINNTENINIYRVQVGAFKNLDNAKKLCEELKQKGYNAIIK